MGFIQLFFKKKEEIKEKDIKRFISQKIEENSNLDYKDIMAYKDAETLSTNISSFANSEGGLLILGISEDEIKDEKGKTIKIYPKEPTWGKVSLDKETLENKLLTLIKPPIDGLTIKPIRNKKNEVIFLIDIPKSPNSPHMTPDYRYHKRVNFRKRLMEHFEISNLFRSNWTMKEKLVEKIYEPLASVLGKHTEQLETFSCPFAHEVKEVLGQTYYKMQIPLNLLERMEHYTDQVEALQKEEYYSRRAMIDVLNRIILGLLEKPIPTSNDNLQIEFRALSETGNYQIYTQDIFRLLLENQKIDKFLENRLWYDGYKQISIKYSNDSTTLGLREFNEKVWNKCLADISTNSKVVQFKKNAQSILEEAQDIIEEIT
jgi:hypothetical protein